MEREARASNHGPRGGDVKQEPSRRGTAVLGVLCHCVFFFPLGVSWTLLSWEHSHQVGGGGLRKGDGNKRSLYLKHWWPVPVGDPAFALYFDASRYADRYQPHVGT